MPQIDADGTITIYQGNLTQEVAARSVAKVKAAFPALAPEFFALLISRAREKGFSDERMAEAVNSVIDTCRYPTPTLAEFLSFDKRIKVFNHDEVCDMAMKGYDWNSFHSFKREGILLFVRKSDLVKYQINEESL